MIETFDQPNNRSLVYHLLLMVGSVLVMNALIFGFGWNAATDDAPKVYFDPPGYVVGAVWTILFALLAISRWRLNYSQEPGASKAKILISILFVSCLIYPLYSLAVGSVIGGLIGNLWTIALAAFAVAVVWRVRKDAALLISPIILWVAFATLITLAELRLIN
jgi:benzodiazapine receptor